MNKAQSCGERIDPCGTEVGGFALGFFPMNAYKLVGEVRAE